MLRFLLQFLFELLPWLTSVMHTDLNVCNWINPFLPPTLLLVIVESNRKHRMALTGHFARLALNPWRFACLGSLSPHFQGLVSSLNTGFVFGRGAAPQYLPPPLSSPLPYLVADEKWTECLSLFFSVCDGSSSVFLQGFPFACFWQCVFLICSGTGCFLVSLCDIFFCLGCFIQVPYH